MLKPTIKNASKTRKNAYSKPKTIHQGGRHHEHKTLPATADKISTPVWITCACCGMEFNETQQLWRGTPSHSSPKFHDRYGFVPIAAVDVAVKPPLSAPKTSVGGGNHFCDGCEL